MKSRFRGRRTLIFFIIVMIPILSLFQQEIATIPVENEPWGEIFYPTGDDIVSSTVVVVYYVDGYCTNLWTDLWLVCDNASSFLLGSAIGPGNYSYTWDSMTVHNGNHEFRLNITDNDYSSNTWVYSDSFTVLNLEKDIQFTNTVNWYLEDWNTGGNFHTVMVIELIFNVYTDKNYNLLLEITDNYGHGWSTEIDLYLSTGNSWVNFHYSTGEIVNTGYTGSQINLRRLAIDSLNVSHDFSSFSTYGVSLPPDLTEDIIFTEQWEWALMDMKGSYYETLEIRVYFEVYTEREYFIEINIDAMAPFVFGHTRYWPQGPHELVFQLELGYFVQVGFYGDIFLSELDVDHVIIATGLGNFYLNQSDMPPDMSGEIYRTNDFNWTLANWQGDHYTELRLSMGFQVYENRIYNIYVDIETRNGIWGIGGFFYLPLGYQTAELVFNIADLINNGFKGGDVQIRRIKADDVAIIAYVGNFWVDPIEIGLPVVEYNYNFNEYLEDRSGVTYLILDLELQIHVSSNYRVVFSIRDNQSTYWECEYTQNFGVGNGWVFFEFSGNDLLNNGFSGGRFFFADFRVYDENLGGNQVFGLYDFQQTRSYDISEFQNVKVRYTGYTNDWIDHGYTEPRLVIEFEYEIFHASNYRAELNIRDNQNNEWSEVIEKYYSNGYHYFTFEFTASYLLNNGFTGSSLYFHNLIVFDQNDYANVAWENGDFGNTAYYSVDDLSGSTSLTFGVNEGDTLEYYINDYSANTYAIEMMSNSLLGEGSGHNIATGDTIRYLISEIHDSEVIADAWLNDVLLGPVSIYSVENHGLLIAMEDIDEYIQNDGSNYNLIDLGDVIDIHYNILNGTIIISYDKDTGVRTNLHVEDYYFNGAEIYVLDMTGSYEQGTETGSGVVFSTYGLEFLAVLMILPALTITKKRYK